MAFEFSSVLGDGFDIHRLTYGRCSLPVGKS